jgi:inosine-uridine nucleoside N-ribohydrolase
MRKLVFILISFLFLLNTNAQVKIIFDTDFGGDSDDLGALAMLHGFVSEKECDLLAVMLWTNEKYAVSAIDALNRYYKHPTIPIGVRAGGSNVNETTHNKILADNFPHELSYEDVPSTTELYRKILAENEDSSIVLVTVGPLLNIKLLLESGPCGYSPLTGRELLHRKVKEMVVMGGQFPSGTSEWNFNGNMPGVTKYVFGQIHLPVVFSGYEIGVAIKTGDVFNSIDKNHPLYIGYYHFSEHASWMNNLFVKGRITPNSTYDQTAVLYAVRGGIGHWWEKIKGGYMKPDDSGGNVWIDGDVTNHSYLKLIAKPEDLGHQIDSFMLFDLKNKN